MIEDKIIDKLCKVLRLKEDNLVSFAILVAMGVTVSVASIVNYIAGNHSFPLFWLVASWAFFLMFAWNRMRSPEASATPSWSSSTPFRYWAVNVCCRTGSGASSVTVTC